MVHVEIIDNGENMSKVKDSSQDFVVASHFFEHCADSIMAFKNLMRVTKKNGHIFLVIPDKRYTFDVERPITPFEHILEDHRLGPDHHKRAHFDEWVQHVDGIKDPEEALARAEKLIEMDYSIHYHVWASADMLNYFLSLRQLLGNIFEIELFSQNMTEMIFVLKKL